MRAGTALVVAATMLFCTTASAATIYTEEIGHWILQCDTNNDGKFAFCVTLVQYGPTTKELKKQWGTDTIENYLSWDGADVLGIGWASKDWTVTEDKIYKVKMKYKDGMSFNFDAKGMKLGELKGVGFAAPPDKDFLDYLMGKEYYELTIGKKKLNRMYLTGSRKAITKMMIKANEYAKGESSDSNKDSFDMKTDSF